MNVGQRIVFLFLGFSLWAGDLPTADPQEIGLSPVKLEAVSAAMQNQVDQNRIAGGSVIIARGGKVAYFETFGMRDLANEKPMTEDTIVRLRSMTKPITTVAALMLVDEGKLDPQAPAADYVPVLGTVKVWTEHGPVPPNRPITVADLMRHTAGFGLPRRGPVGKAIQDAKPWEAADLDGYVARLASAPLLHHPGERWTYSFSSVVLGLVVQNAAGQPLPEVFQTRIFDPLGMADTGFVVPEAKRDRFAVNYRRGESGLEAVTRAFSNERYYQMPAAPSGGGGLVGTASDYMRFLLMIANGGVFEGKRYLSKTSIQMMLEDQLPEGAFPIRSGSRNMDRDNIGFSFGFSVTSAPSKTDPANHVGEIGWGGADSTHFWISPADDNLIVITLEQITPFNFETEELLKPLIYDALVD